MTTGRCEHKDILRIAQWVEPAMLGTFVKAVMRVVTYIEVLKEVRERVFVCVRERVRERERARARGRERERVGTFVKAVIRVVTYIEVLKQVRETERVCVCV